MTLFVLLTLLNTMLFVIYSRNLPPPPATDVVIPRAPRVPREFLTGAWEHADGRVYE